MWARIIFCTSVLLAILVVILLALLSPTPHNILSKNHTKPPWLALSLYIQQPHIGGLSAQPVAQTDAAGALIFHRTLTEGPENTSRVVGKAQGFIIPVEQFAHSDFNILYLSFDTAEYSGSLSVKAKHVHKDVEELTVVGGTGSFAFARGLAVFAQTAGRDETTSSSTDVDATYHVKLQLRFPNNQSRSSTIPG
ncbi:Disease resistance response protein [Parasponia andersonii]|uniref:Dirigent protein n=1 Tax=Parasponia andersonii TaxID=3476 RepID=A0A2P5DA55_PARAD|nr:Disease resistance response protein [Parasponia andersonii]